MRSILKRLAKTTLLPIVVILAAAWLAATVQLWVTFRNDPNHRHQPVVQTIKEFITDWGSHEQPE